MDAVKSFNAELSSLYDVKPPISKAKMTALTRGAIKGIKFYKHVVQSVEKFILKCKPEYKVPGLYVIDSIVRQSRHQFGTEKDVFAPRFAKNMQQTFVNLFRCPPEDKSKIIRVLNLWQKNQVFGSEVVQPLFDLADPNHPIHREQAREQAALAANGVSGQGPLNKGSPATQKTPTKKAGGENSLWANTSQQDATNALAHLGVASLAANPTALLQLTGQPVDPNMLIHLQTLQRLLLRQPTEASGSKPEGGQVHFDRKLLDFDYESDEEGDFNNPSPKNSSQGAGLDSVGSLLSNPEVMRQLQTLQQQLSQQQQIEMEEKMRKLQEMKQQEEEFDKHLAQTVPNLPFAAECELKPASHNNSPANMYKHEPAYVLPSVFDLSQPPPGYKNLQYEGGSQDETMESEIEFMGDNGDVEVINLDHSDSRSPSPHSDRYNRRRRSSRSPRERSRERERERERDRRAGRRSRSRSRSRRRRSRSRDRERDKEKEKEREKEREKDRERRKRGLPPLKKDNLSVCSTTLWVGHLSKLVHQEDLSDTFGEFGDIVSIDLIPPRGCAFIVMNRRQDAARCLGKLKNHKMHGKAITLAWAPGKGVKGKDFKDYWEVDLGVSYIPWNKVKAEIDLELLEDGGMVDEETMPDWLKLKQAELLPKPPPVLITKQSDIPLEPPPVMTLTEPPPSVPPSAPAPVDTSQPPPLHTSGLLPPPPMAMPLVSPFSLNTRLLGAMGHMSLPPGMMPNVPIGVPPPSLAGPPMMPNQLLGMGSPFGMPPQAMSQIPLPGNQEKPGILPTPTPSSQGENSIMGGTNNSNPFQSDDNMDIEMEDAESHKPEIKPIALSDQLLASISGGNFNNSNNNTSSSNSGNNPTRNIPPLIPITDVDERQLPSIPSLMPHRDNRDSRPRERGADRERERGVRDRDRDRERDRDVRERDNRDRPRRDNDSRDRGRGDRNDRRDRTNRWSDRDRRGGDRDRNDREPEKKPEHPGSGRPEKSLADRLREIAHDGAVSNRDRAPRDRSEEQPPPLFPPAFPNGDHPPHRDGPHPPHRDGPHPPHRDGSHPPHRDGPHPEREIIPELERMEPDKNWRDRPGPEPDMFRGGPPGGPKPDLFRGGSPGHKPDMFRGGPPGPEPDMFRDGPPGPKPDMFRGGPPGPEPDMFRGGPPGPEPEMFRGGPPGPEPEMFRGGPPGPDPMFRGGPPGHEPEIFRGGPPGSEPDMFRGGPPEFPEDDFNPRMRRHPEFDPRLEHSDHDPRRPMHPDFEPPPRRGMHHENRERFEFGMRGREGFDRREGFRGPMPPPEDMHMMDNFDHRMRGPAPDFFPPRDGFGPRPMMRGPPGPMPDAFPGPRPLMRRPPGPHMFHPREPSMGPPIRGPRPGVWMGNMRPNFPPRFDGPGPGAGPDHFNHMPFDDPHHPRHRRFEDRRRPPFHGDEPPFRGDEPPFRGDEPPFRGDEPPFRGDEPPGFRGDEPPGFRGDEPPGFRGDLPPGFRGDQPPGFRGDHPPGFRGDQPPGFRGDQPPGFRGNEPPGFSDETVHFRDDAPPGVHPSEHKPDRDRDRKSRWGNKSPTEGKAEKDNEESKPSNNQNMKEGSDVKPEGHKGGLTPLHDEPEEKLGHGSNNGGFEEQMDHDHNDGYKAKEQPVHTDNASSKMEVMEYDEPPAKHEPILEQQECKVDQMPILESQQESEQVEPTSSAAVEASEDDSKL